MILLTHETRILLSVAPADFRKGIDGFVALCQNNLALQPRDGSVIVFINRARQQATFSLPFVEIYDQISLASDEWPDDSGDAQSETSRQRDTSF